MDKFLRFIKEKKKVLIIGAVLVVVLFAAFMGLKLLSKVGNPKYLYNYMHDARGSLPVVQYAGANKGASDEMPHPVEGTFPENQGVSQKIFVNGKDAGSFRRSEEINFTEEFLDSFASKKSVMTFRGDYRRALSSGVKSVIDEEKFDASYWVYKTGKVLKNDGVSYWSGNGWTGQPLIAVWPEETKKHMNLYEDAAKKAGLCEVIYAGMDGWIHFLDLETGEETRPGINVGMTFKGTASLYPDGETPLLFCGSGDAQTGIFGENVSQRFYVYSLIDGSLLYQGGYDDDFAPRIWHAYDSSPIIDPVTDTLIQPGENGVIYTVKLGTSYNRETGELSIAPTEEVKFTFDIRDHYKEGGFLWGSECSACVYGGYLFIGDNGGSFYCLDLNSMTMVWRQDLKEDINASPIFETDALGQKFIYAASTLKYGYNAHSMGQAVIYKLNAMTGAIVWEKPYEVHTVKGYAGGVLSTGALGKGPVDGMIFYSVSKTPGIEEGYLVALDTESGEELWRLELPMYSWSSTVLTYSIYGKAYLIQGCQNGDLLLIDAAEGKILDSLNFGSAIEATPAIYGNRLVFGTRNERIIGVSLK